MTTATGALEAELRRRVQGEVRFDAYSKAMYSTDASIYRMDPVGVVIPRNADDAAAVVEICHRSGTAALPRGGGTGLAGQTVNHAVVMDFSKYMHGVVEVNAEERWARAQPGITLDELNHHLRPHRLHFPPDPTTSNRATVGGAIGNNSCGSHSVLYGKTSDHVKEVSVALSDGTPAILGSADRQGFGSQAERGRTGRPDIRRHQAHCRGATRRNRAPLPQDHAPRIRLQPGHDAGRGRSQHGRDDRRLRRNAGHGHRGQAQSGALAQHEGGGSAALPQPHRGYGRHAGHIGTRPIRGGTGR